MTNEPTWNTTGRSAPPAFSNPASSAGCISCACGTVIALNGLTTPPDCARVPGTIASANMKKRRISDELLKRIDNSLGNRSFYRQVRSTAVIDENRDGHFEKRIESLVICAT